MTPSASPSSETSLPGFPSRELVDLLLEEGEQTALQDAVAIETDDNLDNFDDIVSGWGHSLSLPKPAVRRQRGKKGPRAAPADIDVTNIRVRCISEDYNSDHHRSSWKANVEPGTYRYISNNGIYRSTKFASAGNDWVTVKRSKHLDTAGGLTTTPEVRQAQKTLKKDLSQMFRSTDTAKSEPRNPEKASSQTEESLPPQKPVKSSSAAAIGDPSDRRPVTRDAFKDPKLVKSTSDLFVEKFSTRMDALEKSEKEMLGTPNPRTPVTPSKPGANLPSNYGKRQEHSSSDLAHQSSADDIAKDVFTVKPVTRPSADQPLRPLEKLTPQQKSMDRANLSECSSHNSRSEPESPVLPTSFMNAMNAFAQLHHHNLRGKDNNKNRSGPSTYRSRHKNSLGSVSASSNFSDTDSLNSVRNALTLTNTSIERMRMKPYGRDFTEKDYGVKDYGKFLSGKYRLGTSNKKSMKPPHGNVQRKGIVGYRPTITQSHTQTTSGPVAMTTAAVSRLAPSIQPITMAPSVEDVRSNISDSNDSYLSGTSMKVHRGSGGLTEPKSGTMALPEISGKRLPVPMSSQRLL